MQQRFSSFRISCLLIFQFFFLYWTKSCVNQPKISCFQISSLLSLNVCGVQRTLISSNVLLAAVRNVLCSDLLKNKNKTKTHPATKTKNKRRKKNKPKPAWRENRLLFQFIFWCLHVAPLKAGGAQRSPR